jgi:hypothetical protein
MFFKKRKKEKLSQKKVKSNLPKPNRPFMVVGIVACTIAFILLFGNKLTYLMVDRLNPQFTIERVRGEESETQKAKQVEQVKHDSVADREVYRSEIRLRETIALSMASYLTAIKGLTEGQQPKTVNSLVVNIVQQGQTPPGLEPLPQWDGFVSETNNLSIRYNPDLLLIEVVALPNERRDGPGFLIRIPDIDPYDVPRNRMRYFESIRIEGITVPPPFALSASVQSHGWRSQIINSQITPDVDMEQLAKWVKEYPSNGIDPAISDYLRIHKTQPR